MINTDSVSVIMPIYNEEKHIKKALDCIINQTWNKNIEIIIVDNESKDNTLALIEEVKSALPENITIRVFTNNIRNIPKSLNMACQEASNDVIIRIDGHTYAPLNYVEECVKTLKAIDFKGVVGGRCVIKSNSESLMAEAIAIGVRSKVGIGNAAYRNLSDTETSLLDVDTVPFGGFTKSLWNDIGGYDENLPFDEDYDYNYRAKQKGYRVVLNTRIVLDYFARKNLKLLSKQYFNYGYWANKFCIKHKIIPSFRRLVPLVFILSLIITPFIHLLLFNSIIISYILVILAAAIYEGIIKRKNPLLTLNILLTFITLHFSYGIGSLLSVVNEVVNKIKN